MPVIASSALSLLLLPAPAPLQSLEVAVDGRTHRFALTALEDFDQTAIEIRGARGSVTHATAESLGVRSLRGAVGELTLCATVVGGSLRGELVDHSTGALYRLDETPLPWIAPRIGTPRPVRALPAERVPFGCGVGDGTGDEHVGGHDHDGHGESIIPPAAPAMLGGTCRRECVFLCDSDFLFFQAYGPAPANTTAAILQTMNTVDAVYEKHVGVSFAASAIIVRTDPATDPYAGLVAAGAVLDRARVEWTGTTLYERDLVHMFSGTGYSDGIAGVAWVGVVCSSYGVGMTRFADSAVMCHEVGHNFGAPHCADEPCDTMCGGCLLMGPNDKIIMTNHRNGVACLAEDPSAPHPIPPDAQLDRFSVATGSAANALDVLANDTDYSCEPLVIGAFDATSARGGSVALGSAEDGSTRLLYTPPAGYFGSDTFTYTLVDADGLTDDAEVRVTVTTASRYSVGRTCDAITQSLQQAIDFADPVLGADIDVGPGRYGSIDFRGKPVRLRASAGPLATFIDGAGARCATISGAGANGALIEGFTLHGGSAAEGGGILLDGVGGASVRNCRFIGTAATTRGGAIMVRGTTATIADCLFDQTTAASGGAIMSESSTVTVERCDFFRTSATAGSGGALLATGPAICRVTSSTAAQCSATANGGTLRFEGGTTGQVGDCAFCGGTPNNISGAYQNLGGNSSLANCADCAALPWRNASDCDANGTPDHCDRYDGTAADANGDGLPDGCESLADLLLADWNSSCGGNGSAYELVLVQPAANWLTAYNAAIARGGRLATITSQSEADFVYRTLVSNGIGWAGAQGPWIGLYKQSGVWRWVTNEPYEFTQWAPGEPNNSGDRARYWNPAGVSPTWDDQPAANTSISFLVEYADATDCNGNGLPDARDIALGVSADGDGDGVPDECAPPCPADLDGSGTVDAADLAALLGAWGSPAADLDGNGAVDAADLAVLLGAWGPC
ncbi:MAG: M12 family metallo-peptidase [Phycisphaerales bacterium]